ncbi:MAG: hypothetical protein GWP08_13375 [Nitrospiraceae bacterium]|nr:hypothetical protein [Nitrospiraceae bacterium]
MAGFDLFGVGGRLLSGIILIPYFAWGIHTLRIRYVYHHEIPAPVQAMTLAAVAVFYAVESFLLRAFMAHMPVLFMFSILGLVVSGAALYGQMVISLCSQVLVDFVMPKARSGTREPRYAPAEALEREGDYEGALQEYLVIARIFPKESTAQVRIGGLYARLGQPEEAARWFECVLDRIDSAEKCLQVVNRLSRLYLRDLERRGDAARVLERYLERFPDAEYAQSVRERLQRLEDTAD